MLAQFNKRSDVTKKLSVLSPEELQDLVCSKVCDLLVIFLVHLHLVTIYLVGNTIFLYSSSWCLAKIPGQRGLIFFLKSWSPFLRNRQYQREAINALPLYPNEQIMWDASLVPCIYHGEGCLALPKLNLQFLTLHDYLLRIFNLFLLESILEIREDIQEAQPNIGEVKPASVTEDVMLTQDVLTVPERLGLQFVCGGEYFMDVNDITEKSAEDVYGTFNILLKRKPKEKLQSNPGIHKRPNESCIVPDWLHYKHARFSWHCRLQRHVCFTGPDGNEISNPEPPSRLKFPKALKSSTHALPANTKSAKDEQNDVHMVDAGSELEKLIVEAYAPPIQVHIPKISLESTPLNLHPPRLEPSSLVYSQA
ncbi:hypothetical protein MKW92_011945 [Papaver armeniacum]|nr:hypothetical protein MKW92_011945 [Papaver armeniacum]